ncbi:MAG TPA: hypothetical protein VJ997_09435, partial [Longimicrobiales bacterium]|nr:hypothetical protein [Longimicrobiales bacterium]
MPGRIPSVLAVVATFLLAFSASAQNPERPDSVAAAAGATEGLPLVPTRTLRFTTREGTWISLDVSPDGTTIVFELLGDLYTLPLEGGTATRITSGQAYDMQPRYSPDGAHLVFVSDRDGSENVWIANADGTAPRALTKGERESYMSPVWEPGGDYVIADKAAQLWLYHKDGGSGIQITGKGEDTQPSHLGPAFGADPRYVWLTLRGSLGGGFDTESPDPGDDLHGLDGPRSSARQISQYQVGQLDRESGRVLVRTHELEGAFRPMPSPDGKWLVYATRYDAREALKIIDLATGEDRWLVMDVQRDESEGGGSRDRDLYPGSAFTPDGGALVTSFGGKIWSVAIPSGETTEIPFSAEVDQQLGPLVKFDYPINDSTLTVSQIRGARVSPDGRRVVFAALDRLYTAELPASDSSGSGGHPVIRDARRLTSSDLVEHAPVWSPDGRYVMYVTWSDSTGGDVWRIRSDGEGRPERLSATSAFYDKPTYSRDGSRIIAIRGSKMHRMRTLEDFGTHSGGSELEYVWMPATGGEPARITWVGSGSTEEGRNAPHVGPDPDRVYIWADSEGLLSMRYDGTDVRTVVKVTAPAPGSGGGRPPDEVVLSPDGRRALVRANRNVFMITVPPVGGEAPTVSVSSSSSVPTRRLTQVGGDFIGWRADGAVATYSIGRSLFLYDIARADSLIADSLATARAADASPAARDQDAADEDAAEAASADDDDAGMAYEASRVDVEIVARKDRPTGTVVLSGARLITMRGAEVIASGDVVV